MTQLAEPKELRPFIWSLAGPPVTAGLMIATAMQAADPVLVNVALPQLTRDLGGELAAAAWVLTGYLCATAVVAPLTGCLRRRYGARRLFIAAMGVFIIAALACTFAPSLPILIAFRVLQGAGGGVMAPLSQAILLDRHPRERHGRMLACWGAATMLGPVVGPLLGGIITDAASWHWVFAVHVPCGAFALWCVWRLPSGGETGEDVSLDPIGVFLLMVAVGAIQLALTRSVGHSWFDGPELSLEMMAALVATVLLLRRARHARGFAVVRTAVFRDRNFAVAAFYNVMLSALLFVSVVFLPLLGQGALGFNATAAGALIVPRAVLMLVVMVGVGRAIGRVSFRILLAAGWLSMAAGLAILAGLQPGDAALWIITGSMIQALGAAMLYTPLSTLAYDTLAPGLRTDAAGLYSLLRQLAYACGIALMTAVLHLRMASHLAAMPGDPGLTPAAAADLAVLRAYTDCFRMLAIATLAILPGVLLFRPRPPKPAAPA